MKKKGFLILFTIGFMFMIPIAKADTYKFRYYLPNFTTLSKADGYFTDNIVLGDYKKDYLFSEAQSPIDSNYFLFQLNLLSVSDPIIGNDFNQMFDSTGSEADAIIIYPDGSSAHVLINSNGFNNHYAYQQDVSFSVNVMAIFYSDNRDIYNQCQLQSGFGSTGSFKCEVVPNASFKGFRLVVNSVGGASGHYQAKISFAEYVYLYDYNSNTDITGAIKDQTNQQHQDSQAQLEEQKKQTDAITSESDDIESSQCGLICKIGGVFKGIIELPGKLITLLIDALKSLFIPKDMTFINNFMESIENKLGFIATIPMSVIRFTLNLATASWEDFTSITFPSISIFGYNFWQSQEIDLTDAINIFKPFKYFTDIVCVTLFCSTLLKWYERFNGGDSH